MSLLRPDSQLRCLVTAAQSMSYAPLGPNEVRTISLSSFAAPMFLKTDSSRPDICCYERLRQKRPCANALPNEDIPCSPA